LRDEPSSVSLTASFNTKTSTDNVVKVCGLATAIARAEEVIRERVKSGSRPDIFEALVSSPQLTDDASGPALYQPYIPTPIPPRASSTLPPPSSTLEMLPAPPRMPSIVVLDPHAFYHPPYRPAFAPARPRRSAFGAFAIAFIAPLVAVALLIGGVSYAKTRKPSQGTAMTTTSIVPRPPGGGSRLLDDKTRVSPVKLEAAEPVVASASPPSISVKAEEPPMLVVEVKALKSAPPRKRR
jgi:hypothetical protein